LRKRDETKAELKALLKRYITSSQDVLGTEAYGVRNQCAKLVGLAQTEMDGMHSKQDRTVIEINKKNLECKAVTKIV
jgi:hypothetical protein